MPLLKRNYKRKAGIRRRGRRMYKPRMSKAVALHAPKQFTCTWSLPIDSFGAGTHVDGYNRQLLSVRLSDLPIFPTLFGLYGQFAITSIKLNYVPEYNVSTGTAANSVPNIVFAEDKDTDVAQTYTVLKGQDNVRTLSSARKWSAFIKKPRPALYQQNAAGERVKVIQRGKEIHWLSPKAVAADPASDLVHLYGQMCVQDIKGIAPLANATVGTLYFKVYIACKEQRL